MSATVKISSNEAVSAFLAKNGTKDVKAAAKEAVTVNRGRGNAKVMTLSPAKAKAAGDWMVKQADKLSTAESADPADKQLARWLRQVADRIPGSIEAAEKRAAERAQRDAEQAAAQATEVKDETETETDASGNDETEPATA